MKFPKFVNLFKRSQSDSALSSCIESAIAPAQRPCSLSAVDDLVLPLDASNPFASQLLATGFLVQAALTDSAATNLSSAGVVSVKGSGSNLSSASSGHISAASHTVVVEVLTRRIQELEEQRARAGCQSAQNDSSGDRVEGTCEKLEQQNRQLSTELSDARLSLTRTIQQLSSVQTKNERLQALFDLPILASVFQAVLSGATPLDALINSVKHAITQPPDAGSSSNPWRTLLEPVVGPRSPEDYIAQVNCTLRARRESRDWRKKAVFWKGHAREDGRHQDTVTPSSSQLSDILDGGCVPQPGRVQDTRYSSVKLSAKPIGVEAILEVHDSGFSAIAPDPIVPPTEAGSCAVHVETRSSVHSASGGDHAPETVNPRLTYDELHLAISEQPVSPCDIDPCPQNDVASTPTYGNLPPLASITFRESHSIRSISSKKDYGHLTSSSSTASVHRKSRHSVRGSSVDLSVLRELDSVSVSASVPSHPIVESLSVTNSVLEPISESHAEPENERVRTPSPTSTPADESNPKSRSASSDFSFGSGSWEHLSTFLNKSFSIFGAESSSTSRTAATKLQDSGVAYGQSRTTEAAQQAEVGNVNEANSKLDSAAPTPSSTPGSSPNSSPVKKSRLPVMRKTKPTVQSATAKFIKRLSKNISKPLLVESTNAAVIDTRTQPSKAPMGRARAGSSNASGMNKAKVTSGVAGSVGWKNQKGRVAVSPATKKVGKGAVRA